VSLILIDSHDSFTWNLVQALQCLGERVHVVQSHDITVRDVMSLSPSSLVLGPGPGHPAAAGSLVQMAHAFAGKIPILGVCLGHQAIAMAFGAGIERRRPVHGHAQPITHLGTGVFAGLPPRPSFTRYHSLVVSRKNMPSELEITAVTSDGIIMGLRHRSLPVEGVQFHPESVLSGQLGLQLLKNFTQRAHVGAGV